MRQFASYWNATIHNLDPRADFDHSDLLGEFFRILLGRIRRGDQNAFAELHRLYHRRVLAFAQKRLADAAGDAVNPAASAPPTAGSLDTADIVGISFSVDAAKTTLTTSMRLKNLSQVPIPGTTQMAHMLENTLERLAATAPGGGARTSPQEKT